MAQENNSSNSAWSENVGAWALLYLAQVSRHLMPSVVMGSKRTLDLTGLELIYKKVLTIIIKDGFSTCSKVPRS